MNRERKERFEKVKVVEIVVNEFQRREKEQGEDQQVCIHEISRSPARLCLPGQKLYGPTDRPTDRPTDGHTLL